MASEKQTLVVERSEEGTVYVEMIYLASTYIIT